MLGEGGEMGGIPKRLCIDFRKHSVLLLSRDVM